jgi:hypothetical protein
MPSAYSPYNNRKRLGMFLKALPFLLIAIGGLVAVTQLKVVREFFSRASGEEANLTVDTQAVLGPMPRPWRNLAQGGEQFNWRMGPILSQVRSLKPEYIRIDHIYDFYDIVGGTPGNLTFDFSKLDGLLDDIKAAGAKPYIALSYMPPVIANGDILAKPARWEDWQLVVQKTIEHVSGERRTPDVYYEVWNEPDLFGNWKYSGDKNYLTLYMYAARGANAARGVLPFKFGGPAITALYKNWFDALAKFAIANNLRFDFFSWHRYDRKTGQFEKDISDVHEWLKDYPQYQNMEMVISEWGHNSNNDRGYDTSFGAAHTVATAIQMVGNIDKGFVFEIEDGKDPEGNAQWGRWGLLTNQAFGAQPKSRYYGLRLLDRIGETRLDLLGKGTWVKALAARSLATDNVTVVLANYDPAFDNVETVPITFFNVFPGAYTIKHTFLGGTADEEQVATTEASLKTTLTMPANSVALLELIRTPLVPESTNAAEAATRSAFPAVQIESTTPISTSTPIVTPFSTPIPLPTQQATSSASPTGPSGFGRLIER